MKSLPRRRIAAMATLGMAFLPAPYVRALRAQDDASPKTILLSRARTLEGRGRLDLAKQDWTQVLLMDPSNAEALAGLVRAARAEGRSTDANNDLARLRAAHPADPELARLDAMGKTHDTSLELTEAARLAHEGDPRAAMVLYRRVYGMNPPAGEPAVTYFETEAATEEGKPHAIAGLRALADRFPAETRYQIALGRVLLTGARTRAEGRTLLERYPENAEAIAALHGTAGTLTQVASAAGSSGKGSGAASSEVPVPPQGPKATVAPAGPPRTTEMAGGTVRPAVRAERPAPAAQAMQTAAVQGSVQGAGSSTQGHHLAFAVDEQAAYNALNQHRMTEAEQRFTQILAKDPKDSRALAGLGYLRVVSGDLKTAVSYFEQAQENGDHTLALTRAMISAQFELALRQAAAERARGNLGGAEGRYRAALRERPSDPEALDGLAQTLLQGNRAADAAPVYRRLTEVRPMSPAAWRGLVVAQADSGRGAAALATDAQVPSAAKGPLLQDPTYQITLASVRGTQPTQVAKVEPPAVPVSSPHAALPRIAQPTSSPRVLPPVSKVAPPPPPSIAPQPAQPKTAVPGPTVLPKDVAPRPPALAGNIPPKSSRSAPVVPAPVPSNAVLANVAPPPPTPATNDGIASERMRQADLALMHGESSEAATLFHDVLARAPEKPEAWRGLVLSLHRNGRESDAAATLGQIPPAALAALEKDASFQSAAGAVYLASNQPQEALRALARAQEVFSSQRLMPPLNLVLQTARLLSARADDENLYRELMYLGGRKDLEDAQRAEVQMIWTQWAVRRARTLSVAGEDKRAVVLLNAAAVAFAGNGEVLRAIATGYAGVGRPREAVALYKTQDVAAAPAPVIEAAVEAATAARDFKAAETWIHLGLYRFGQDPQMLTAAAELEQARGHEKRAVELSKQAKSMAPPQDPGQVLAAELKEAKAGSGWMQPIAPAGQLSVLLAPSDPAVVASGTQTGRPYLPAALESGSGPTRTSGVPILAGYDEPSL